MVERYLTAISPWSIRPIDPDKRFPCVNTPQTPFRQLPETGPYIVALVVSDLLYRITVLLENKKKIIYFVIIVKKYCSLDKYIMYIAYTISYSVDSIRDLKVLW